MVIKRPITGTASGWTIPLFVLLCVLTGLPAQAQPGQLTTADESSVQTLAATAGAAAPEGDRVARELPPDGAREDLSVFFSIGIAIDVLLLTGFLVWALGQWRRTRK